MPGTLTSGSSHMLYKEQIAAAGNGSPIQLAIPCKCWSLQVRGDDGKWDVRLELSLDGQGWNELLRSKSADGGVVFVVDSPATWFRCAVKAMGNPITVMVLATT